MIIAESLLTIRVAAGATDFQNQVAHVQYVLMLVVEEISLGVWRWISRHLLRNS